MLFRRFGWAVLWALLIFFLCFIPGKDLPHHSIFELLSFDKLVHFTLFFVLLILIKRALRKQDSKNMRSKQIIYAILCIVYGGSLEIMQGMFLVDRQADVYDFLANSLGVGVAFILRSV